MEIHLSDGEWKLMNCLWDHTSMTITELTRALEEETGWSKHTIITMLARLESKGMVGYQGGTRAKHYFACIPRSKAAQSATTHFLGRVYGGNLGIMMNALINSKALTPEDIDELSAILEKAKEEKEL